MIFLDEADLDYIPSTKGEDVGRFERAMAHYLAVDEVVAVNSGTSALHLALLACGIGRGDTVVVPATTFVATANAVLYTGAKVKIVDIDAETWNLQERVYKKASAVIPVCLYGKKLSFGWSFHENQKKICDLSEGIHLRPHAEAINSTYSFNGNKTMTTGGGGLIAGSNLDEIRSLIRPAYHDGLGYNFGMAAHNARLGLQQLENLEENIKKKLEFNSIYRTELSDLVFQSGGESPYWMTAVLFPDSVDILAVRARLEVQGIPTRRVFKPLNHYSHLSDGRVYTNAEYVYDHGLCLPSSTKNDSEDVYNICKEIKKLT